MRVFCIFFTAFYIALTEFIAYTIFKISNKNEDSTVEFIYR